MAELLILPAVIMGGIIGIIELVFVHSDERGLGWLGHGLHAIPLTMLFVFASMNISYVFGLLNLPITENNWVNLGVRVAVGLIAMLKVAGAAAVVGRVGERWYHILIIGALIVGAPYAWLLIGPMIEPLLPNLGFGK